MVMYEFDHFKFVPKKSALDRCAMFLMNLLFPISSYRRLIHDALSLHRRTPLLPFHLIF